MHKKSIFVERPFCQRRNRMWRTKRLFQWRRHFVERQSIVNWHSPKHEHLPSPLWCDHRHQFSLNVRNPKLCGERETGGGWRQNNSHQHPSGEDYLISVISSKWTPPLLGFESTCSRFAKLAFAQKWKSVRLYAARMKDSSPGRDRKRNTSAGMTAKTTPSFFDVCADDHCQRYRGITKASNATVAEAARPRMTSCSCGQGICDARFSNVAEGNKFGYCWEDKDYPIWAYEMTERSLRNSPTWLRKRKPNAGYTHLSPAFCNTDDKKIISQILNNYDRETTDFYRWKVRYTQEELVELIRLNTKTDYGSILDFNSCPYEESRDVSAN